MKKTRHRIKKLDNLRAIAIIVVVLGHSIILYSGSWGDYQSNQTSLIFHYLKEMINLFQMPLFFSLSGYLFAKTDNKDSFLRFMLKKFKRLIIPFLFIGLIYMIPIKLILNYPGYVGIRYYGAMKRFLNGGDMGHLWFLPTLFLSFIAGFWIKKFNGNQTTVWALITLFAIALSFVSCKNEPYINYLRLFLNNYWSFTFGALISCINLQKISAQWKISIACAALLVSAAVIFLKQTSILSFIASVLLTLTCYLFVPDSTSKYANLISKNSFGIYLLHSPLIYITFTYMLNAAPVIVFIVNFFIFGGLAFILSEFLAKTPIRYLMGQWS